MEEENNNEEVKTAAVKENFFGKVLNWIKEKWYIVVAGVVAIIIAIVAISSIAGAKTKALKNYVKAFNNGSVSKFMKTIDIKGVIAWNELNIYYDDEDFEEEDYEEFIEAYENIDDDDFEDWKEEIEEDVEQEFDDMNDEYKNFKLSIKEIKNVKKIGKDLNAIKVKLHYEAKDKDGDEESDTETGFFITYKNKIIYPVDF